MGFLIAKKYAEGNNYISAVKREMKRGYMGGEAERMKTVWRSGTEMEREKSVN